MDIRVRIAPSPTGVPHIGNTRTALFNFLFAKHNNGKFILRIEDTDRTRLVPEAEEKIKEILEWLGLVWDEFYKQSERLALYQEAANDLLARRLAHKDEGAIRFKMPKDGETQWIDEIGNKTITFDNKEQEDFIILKSDNFPTYNFANVIDDHEMKISHVIRGDEFISSTPKHIQLYKAFDWPIPKFAHLPVILGPDKTKLSKRHGAESVLEYRDKGYLKEALLNFMALLGWNPGGDREIMSLDEMIKLFDLRDVNTNAPVFDLNKLTWLNGYYIRKSNIYDLKTNFFLQNPKLEMIDDRLLDKLVSLAQSRMKTLKDFEALVVPFFAEITSFDLSKDQKDASKRLSNRLMAIEKWDAKHILSSLQAFCQEEKANMKLVYRILTGREQGLPLADTLAILGKDQTLARLKNV